MIPNNHKTKFIVFEGIDGSGKSSQYELLKKLLASRYPKLSAVYPKEPDKNRPIGNEIYRILNNQHPAYQLAKMRPYHMQAFYIEDRMFNYRENIIPALQQGQYVIQDRGVASSFCYGAKNPDEFYDFMGLHDRVFSAAQVPFIWPDLILIFDIPAEVALKRMTKTGKIKDGFEQKKKLRLVRRNYLAFAKKYSNCVVVNGIFPETEVFEKTKSYVLLTLGFKNRN